MPKISRYQFVRLKQVLKELSELTVPSEDCDSPEYVDELRQEATEIVDVLEKAFAQISVDLIERTNG
jgi:uncharacterized protein YejL (UPF0352 family)